MKPDPLIYKLAIEHSGVSPDEIFFTDDRPENIAAAKLAGIQAVQFHSEERLISDMREFGISANSL